MNKKVCIGICTYRRPKMLEKCLESVAVQQNIYDLEVIIVVLDNNITPEVKSFVDGFKNHSQFPIIYIHEERAGIPIARNRILREALKQKADWIAFIDDDECAAPNWLYNLLYAAEMHKADVVHGLVAKIFDGKKPFWAVAYSKYERLSAANENGNAVFVKSGIGNKSEGQKLERCSTANVIFSSRLLSESPFEGFDERLRFSGGSDVAFFNFHYQKGARIVHSNLPVVYEIVLPSRFTYKRQVLFSFRTASNRVQQFRQKNTLPKSIMIFTPYIVSQYAQGSFQLLIAPILAAQNLDKFKSKLLSGGKKIASASAMLLALFSMYAQPYKNTDGY